MSWHAKIVIGFTFKILDRNKKIMLPITLFYALIAANVIVMIWMRNVLPAWAIALCFIVRMYLDVHDDDSRLQIEGLVICLMISCMCAVFSYVVRSKKPKKGHAG